MEKFVLDNVVGTANILEVCKMEFVLDNVVGIFLNMQE